MNNAAEERPRTFQAVVWGQEPSAVGQHVTVVANNLSQAKEKIKAKYGNDIIISLWDEDDANQAR